MEDVLVEVIAGVVAGCASVTVGMPLDLIKTKLQLHEKISLSMLKREINTHNGLRRTFYRGASSLYVFIGTAAAMQFTVFQSFFQMMGNTRCSKEMQLMSSGFMAGVCSSFIYTPIQFTKIQTQLDPQRQKMGSFRRMYHYLSVYGVAGFKKMYTGLALTLLKEPFGIALYFGGFHVCMRDVFQEKNRERAAWGSQIGSALLAGLIYNLWAFPLDTLKTKKQCNPQCSKFWYHPTFKQGMIVAICRGLMVDSTVLLVYERTKNSISSISSISIL